MQRLSRLSFLAGSRRNSEAFEDDPLSLDASPTSATTTHFPNSRPTSANTLAPSGASSRPSSATTRPLPGDGTEHRGSDTASVHTAPEAPEASEEAVDRKPSKEKPTMAIKTLARQRTEKLARQREQAAARRADSRGSSSPGSRSRSRSASPEERKRDSKSPVSKPRKSMHAHFSAERASGLGTNSL